MSRFPKIPQLIALATVLICALAFMGVPSLYLRVICFALINIIVVCGLVVLYGYCDQVSLATGSFYGIGAYCVAIGTTRYDLALPVALLIGCAIAALAGLLVSIPALRLKSHYLALGTLAFSELMSWVFVEAAPVTGGVDGIASRIIKVEGMSAVGGATVAVACLAALVVFATFNIVRGVPGQALAAIGQNETAARASGVAIEPLKVRAYVFAALTAALGGGLYAALIGFISPTLFGPALSITFLAMAIIGGRETLFGPIVAALVITAVQYAGILIPGIDARVAEVISSAQIDLYALIIIVFTLFLPEGLKRVGQKRTEKRSA